MPVMRLQRELLGVTLSLAAFNFANGLVGVFIPLVLLQAGAPLWQIPAFYLIYAVTKMLVNVPVARYVVQRHGAHLAFAIGFGTAIVEFASLQAFVTTEQYVWPVVAAVAMAVVNACLWLSQHLHISAVIDTSTKSSSMATIGTINTVLSVTAPFVGGLIGALLGPQWLIGVATAVLLLTFFPLRLMRRLDAEHTDTGNSQPLRFSLAGAPKRDVFANVCWNFESATGELVWPLFLAVVIGGYREIGLISAIGAGATVVALWIAGHRGDRGQDRRVLVEAAGITSVANVVRLFVGSPLAITAVTTVYRGSLAYAQIAWVSTYYSHAKREGPAYVMAMEIGADIAYLLLWSLLLVIALTAGSELMFTVVFTAAAVAAWGCLAIRRSPAAEVS